RSSLELYDSACDRRTPWQNVFSRSCNEGGSMRALNVTASLFAAVGFATCAAQNVASANAGTSAAEAKDMALLGYHDLQARSAYHLVVREQSGRWIAYIGHHGGTEKVAKPLNALTGKPEFNGTSILDVTDPRAPRYLAHIPGEEGLGENGGAQMVRVCGGAELPKADRTKFYLLRTLGNSAHEIFDVTDPAKPVQIGRASCR